MEARIVHDKFIKQAKKIAIAESCTGGFLLASLTGFPGASNYLLGGVVAYSNELKQTLLHVSPKTLKEHGAVSKETVIEMIHGLFAITSADIAIAVSGIFGPSGGTPEKPIGTVWMAISEKNKPIKANLIALPANLERTAYRKIVVESLLEGLWNL